MKRLIRQMLRFAAVGLSAFALDYVLFVILHLFGMPYLVANVISYTISTIYNFILSMKFVFSGKSSQSRVQQFFIFTVLGIIGLGLNELYLFLLVNYVSIPPAISKVAATFFVTIFNFITRKIFLEDHGKLALKDPEEEGEFGPEAIVSALEEGTRDVEVIMREQANLVTGKSDIDFFQDTFADDERKGPFR